MVLMIENVEIMLHLHSYLDIKDRDTKTKDNIKRYLFDKIDNEIK